MNNDLLLSLPNQKKLKICKFALSNMKKYLQDKECLPEAGGVLIGRIIQHSQDIVIDSVSEPQDKDKATRYRFNRLDYKHQEIVNIAFNESGGTYLGEWHTHPEPDPSPSCLDIVNWSRKSKEAIYYVDGLIFIILGTNSLGVWQRVKFNSSIIFIGNYIF